MLFQIKSFFKFLVKSTNQHGVHSPFVFDLVTNCFYDTDPKKWYYEASSFRSYLMVNRSKITVEDFGAGSKKLQANTREIARIAKNAGISKKRGQLLGRLVDYLDVNHVLEIGTSLGIATACMHLSKPETNIISLEGCRQTATVALESFQKFNFKNIDVVIGNFEDTLPEALAKTPFDCIYFDGNHQKEPTINYFEQCLKHINNNSMFIFDDIYWSKGMAEAWEFIKNHPKVTVSIDTFYWGIVFFHKEQPKQHFTIRV
tara:strand:+ start:639316 stop:640092 length:777 start_codon:yes stop_codon:yes gene_type:complete